MLGNTLPLNKYIISHIKRFCNKNFTQSDSSNGSLCIMSKRREAKCNCPQPVILKIGNYPSVKNYSNAMKNTQVLRRLILCGIWRLFILIFTGGKENKIISEMQRKHKKFCRIEENIGFSGGQLWRQQRYDLNVWAL